MAEGSQKQTWSVLVVSGTAAIRAEVGPVLAEVLPGVPVSDLEGYPQKRAVLAACKAANPNLCLLDVSTDTPAALTVLEELQSAAPSARIVAVLTNDDPDLIIKVLRMGACDFLVQPVTSDQFRTAMAKVAQSMGTAEPGKVYCVMPAKGGSGASTIACALPYQFKKKGFKRILLADLDALTGTIAFQLKLRSQYSFSDALQNSQNLDHDLWKNLVTPSHGVDVLLPPESPTPGMVDSRDGSPILEYARSAYEVVVVDCANAYGTWNLSLARLCDAILFVTSNDYPSLQAGQRALGYLDQHGIPRSKLQIIVNRYNKELGLSKEMIETALAQPVAHFVPADYDTVQQALLDAVPIPPSSAIGKSLAKLTAQLLGEEEKVEVTQISAKARPQPQGLSSLLTALLWGRKPKKA